MGSIVQDLTYASRTLWRSPAFTIVAILTLAIGIGANTAIFSVVKAVLLEPLAYKDPGRIVAVQTLWTKTNRPGAVSGGDYPDLIAEPSPFTAVARYGGGDLPVETGGQAEFVAAYGVDPGFTDVFQLKPVAGRLITPDEFRTKAIVALVSEGFAVRRDVAGEISAEIGSSYARFSGRGHLLIPLGAGSERLLTRVQFGVGGDELPPHRGFVMGGRGTLLGDEFREWGGRRAALVHLELRTVVPFFGLPAGPARTPGRITLAPYVALGSTDEPFPQMPWQTTPGTRVTLGLGVEWLGLFRIEAGYGTQSRQVHAAFDVTRDFWDIL